ncbi:MAG: hypothetical protein ACI9IP_002479 [Arcticibacterium sp.]|jgi:hypothetical protein
MIKLNAFYGIAILFISCSAFGQWKTNTVGGSNADAYYVNGKIKVTSSGGSVGGDNNYQGIIVNHNNFYTAAATINSAFSTVPTANLFKAQAGVPVNITLEIAHKFVQEGGGLPPTTHQVFINYFPDDSWGAGDDWYGGTIKSSIGKNEQAYLYDQNINLTKNSQYVYTYDEPAFFGLGRKSTFTGTYTFPVGRTRGWIVIGFREKSYTNYNQSSHNNFIVLPFVVEGPTQAQVDSLGVTTKPQVPQMVIHTPPGDGSSTTITNTGTKCRSFKETYAQDNAGTLYGALKLGYKGSIGFVATIDVEAYVEFSASGTAGGFQTKTSNEQTCVTVSNSLQALSAGKGAQGNDLFVGYGIDLAYAKSRNVSIQNNTVVVDTSIVYRPLPETLKQFFLTKSGIVQDIITQQALVNDSINNTVAKRATAQYQIDVWQQVLSQNDANITAAASQTGNLYEFNAGSVRTYDSTIQYTGTQTLDVGHYLEATVGIEGAAYIGGSGFKLGAKFTTKQRFGEYQSVSGGQTKDVRVSFSDNDTGDHFDMKIVRDPVYGTPIFLLDSAQSKSSCPYEGGVRIDQPELKIVGQVSDTISIPNITLGTPGSFQVQVCNTSLSERTYRLGFVSQTNSSDLLITAAGSSGSDFGPFTVGANSCKALNYDVNISRRYPTSDINFSDLELQLFSECEPSIKSSVFANLSFAGPPPATNVAASSNEICNGTPVTLTANCPVTTQPVWYTVAEGGFPIAQGVSVIVNPANNMEYFVGCETVDYKRDRVSSKPILVTTPVNSLNLTANFTANSLQIANTTLTANNHIINPARVKYKAGNSLTFNPGFEAKSGSIFEAEIGGCVN